LFSGMVIGRREIHLSCGASCSVTNGSVIKLFRNGLPQKVNFTNHVVLMLCPDVVQVEFSSWKVFSHGESQSRLAISQASFGSWTSRWRMSRFVGL
ncbi:hypothetical protein Tco_0220217, partial [Tanacetum coccineum]